MVRCSSCVLWFVMAFGTQDGRPFALAPAGFGSDGDASGPVVGTDPRLD